MSEMAMAGAAPKMARGEDPDKPSYLSRADYDGPPDAMPEVGRELTMLGGAIIAADRALHEAFQEFEGLLHKVQPIVDQRPRPSEGMVPLREEPTKGAPQLATGVGGDIRAAYEHVRTLEAQLQTLASRIRNLNAVVAL